MHVILVTTLVSALSNSLVSCCTYLNYASLDTLKLSVMPNSVSSKLTIHPSNVALM